MRWTTAISTAILLAGSGGYAVALWMALRLRRWLGRRGAGWPRILLNVLLCCLAGLGLLFAISLGRTLGVLPAGVRGVVNVGTALFLTGLPWGFAYALHQWRREAERRAVASRGGID